MRIDRTDLSVLFVRLVIGGPTAAVDQRQNHRTGTVPQSSSGATKPAASRSFTAVAEPS
jgi:hypothetical protein